MTEFKTPEYSVNSAGSKTTTILYLYASQSKTDFDKSYINSYINNGEEPVDSFYFPATNTYGYYNLTNPHIFTYESDFKPTKIKFTGKSGDFSAYMGYVFSWGL
jgi:hypothetical protein